MRSTLRRPSVIERVAVGIHSCRTASTTWYCPSGSNSSTAGWAPLAIRSQVEHVPQPVVGSSDSGQLSAAASARVASCCPTPDGPTIIQACATWSWDTAERSVATAAV